MTRHAITTGAGRLVHCSPDRTVFGIIDAQTGTRTMCKLFVRGSLADAQREVTLAHAASGLGVATYREATIDTATNLPIILLEWHDGEDLDQLVAEHGAIPAARTARLLAPVARTLASMHALRGERHPLGICHGDVKPANLLATASHTLLLDFEHARPVAATSDSGTHTTGTVSFVAPEAADGAAPDAATDVFGLGATMRWMLTGGDLGTLPQDREVTELVAACTATDPSQRPTAAAVADTLQQLADRLADDPDERSLALVTAGEQPDLAADSPRHDALRQLAQKQRRLGERLPGLLKRPTTTPATPQGLLIALHHVQRTLRWFPRHSQTLSWRAQLTEAARELLGNTAATVSDNQRDEQFDEACRWLDEASSLTNTLMHLPGCAPIPGATNPRSVGLLQRDPYNFMLRLRDQVEEARAELHAATTIIDSAEERLDLGAAETAIDAMAKRYGGSSPTAARRRDQVHRLAFYLDRITCAQPNVERIAQLWDKNALEPLLTFVSDCTQSTYRPTAADLQTAPLGLRSLQVALINLAEEFPHLYVRSGPALDALSIALQHMSDLAWELVAEASQQLEAVPVPVRPLQITLGRLDTFRILEALVDRPERPRSRLLDAIESMRLKFEQARAARDRLAQGAEQAMARGHWTTGLFDMERAVAGLNPNDEAERAEAERLEERLQEARRKKDEIDAAVRRNVDLGSRYGLLQDDGLSSFNQRLQVLAERRDCLHFLAVNLPTDRAALYTRDLREVELQITLEQAGLAETEFYATDETLERIQLARQTLDRLESEATTSESGNEPPGRLLRLVDHWRTLASQCQRDQERRDAERASRSHSRRRMTAIGIALVTVSLTAVTWAARPWLFGEAAAATRPGTWPELSERARQLPLRAAEPAAMLLASIRDASEAGSALGVEQWHKDFETAMVAFSAMIEGDEPMRIFAVDCWRAGLTGASTAADARELAALRTATARLAAQVSESGVRPPADWSTTVK